MRLLALTSLLVLAVVTPRAQAPALPGGFTPLFNGRSAAGWHWSRTNHHGTTAIARVEDGVLVLQPHPFGQGGLLLTDASYKPAYAEGKHLASAQNPFPPEASVITEFEPIVDAGDFMRFGRDILVQRSHVTNRFGIEWTRRLLDGRFRVHEVAFGSVYRNTLVRFGGVRGKALSRHALGLAMDIVSFTGADGRVVAVESEYPKKDWLLLAIENLVDHDKDWRILLTPKNDPISHKDHFHLEASVDFRD